MACYNQDKIYLITTEAEDEEGSEAKDEEDDNIQTGTRSFPKYNIQHQATLVDFQQFLMSVDGKLRSSQSSHGDGNLCIKVPKVFEPRKHCARLVSVT